MGMARRGWGLVALALVGCQEGGWDGAAERAEAELMRINHLQCKGTHNSYHIEPRLALPFYQYTNMPLDVQAGDQGVRKFELDLHYNRFRDRIDVFHAPVIDRRSNCETLPACVADARRWSLENPGHHPLFFLLEPKWLPPDQSPEDFLALVEASILESWPEEAIVTPDEVQGGAIDLPRALASTGWPSLESSRGKAIFILHDTEALRDSYTYGGESLAGRLMFVESSPGAPYAAVVILNNPETDFAAIQSAVEAGYLVRTRADSDVEYDEAQLEAALASGAHIISTDLPAPTQDSLDYVEIPGGNPSRCNPLTAPAGCTSEAIEDL